MSNIEDLINKEFDKLMAFSKIYIRANNLYSTYNEKIAYSKNVKAFYDLREDEDYALFLNYQSIKDILEDNKIDKEIGAIITSSDEKQQAQYFTFKSFNIASNIAYNVRVYNTLELFDFLGINNHITPHTTKKSKEEAKADFKRIGAYLKEVKSINNGLYEALINTIDLMLCDITEHRILLIAKKYDNFISKYAGEFLSLLLPYKEQQEAKDKKGMVPVNILNFVRAENNFGYEIKCKRENENEAKAFEEALNFLKIYIFPNLILDGTEFNAIINMQQYFRKDHLKTPYKIQKFRFRNYIKKQIEILSNIKLTFTIKTDTIEFHNIVTMIKSSSNSDNLQLGISSHFANFIKLKLPNADLIRRLTKVKDYIAIDIIYYITFQNGRYLKGIDRSYKLSKFIYNVGSLQKELDKQYLRHNSPMGFKSFKASMNRLTKWGFFRDYQTIDKNNIIYDITDLKQDDIDLYDLNVSLTPQAFLEIKTTQQKALEKGKKF